MYASSEKVHFETQYGNKGFFSPKDIQFTIYDKEIWDFVKKILLDSRTVVDLGSGGGTVLYNISKVTTARLTGVDFSDVAATYLKRIVPQATILKEDVTETSLGNGTFDFVVSTMTIEHVDDDKFLKEVVGILKNGDYFFVTTILRTNNAWYFYKDRQGRSVLEPTHLREYSSLDSFLKLLDRYGFTILKAKTPRIKFPLVGPFLKLIFGFFCNEFWNTLPATKPIEFLRKISRVPIPGYYAIEVIAQKQEI